MTVNNTKIDIPKCWGVMKFVMRTTIIKKVTTNDRDHNHTNTKKIHLARKKRTEISSKKKIAQCTKLVDIDTHTARKEP